MSGSKGKPKKLVEKSLPMLVVYYKSSTKLLEIQHTSQRLKTSDFHCCTVHVASIISLTLRRLMSYIYMEHPFLMFLDHTQRRSTVGRTPLDE